MSDYSITAVTRRVVYTGSAGVGPYAFSFPVLTQTDLAVYKNATKLTLTTDYTVSISGVNGTGSITLVSAATGSDRITIIGARTIERTTDFVTAGDLKASFEGLLGTTNSGIEVSWTTVKGRETVDSTEVEKLLGFVPKKVGAESQRLSIKQSGGK